MKKRILFLYMRRTETPWGSFQEIMVFLNIKASTEPWNARGKLKKTEGGIVPEKSLIQCQVNGLFCFLFLLCVFSRLME
jgi:hypothetical protein